MKILAIRIKNLASLEGTTEIDFTAEPLHTAGIFAITGPTGAGKSTILDALCLALYGKTPRYIQAKETGVEIRDIGDNTMNQSDVRGILRDGTADGFAEVDFIGMDNQQYRATWNVKRARNKAEGRIGEATAVLLNIHTNQPFPGKKTETYKEIERLIGLSFEQFTRSVLLAQGDFTAFLKADKREKASLLEKLTGTDIYTHISRKIYERCKNEEIQLRDLENRKKDIRTLTEEELQALKEEQAALQLNIEKTAQQIEGFNNEIVWHEQLLQLQNNEAAAYKLMDQANQAKAAAAEKQLLLQQISQAQKAGIWIAALDAQTEQQAQKRDTLNNCEVILHTLRKQKELLAEELDKSLKEFDDKSKAYSDALPLLHEARSLEILLEEKKAQLEKQEAEVLAVTRKGDEQQQTVQDKKQELESLSGTIEALKKWQDNNNERKPIATNSEFILAKLQDATKSLHALTAIESRKTACQKERSQNDFDKKTLRDELSIQQQQLEQSQKKYESESKALAQIPFSEISDEKEAIARTLNKATLAQAQWKLYYGSLKEINKLTQQLTENEATGEAKKIALDSIGAQLKTEKIKLETSKALLNKARIAATENVISLRDNLTDNEPCPVCGSKEHPYVTHNPNMEKLMDSFAQSYQEQEHLYLSLLKDHASLIQQYDGLQQTNLNLSEELASKRNTHNALQKEWTDIACDIPDLASITDEQKADWLLDRSNELGNRQTALQNAITQYNERRALLEKERVQLEETKSRTDAIDNQLKDKERKDSSLSETLANIAAEETIRLTELNDVIDVLNPYFPVASWVDNWKKAPLPFAEHIGSFATEWKEREENLLSLLQQYSIAEATLIGLEKQYKDIAADISEKRELLTTLQEQKTALALQRNALFEGAPVADVETRLKTAMEKAQVSINTIKETQHKLGNDETKALTQSEQIISDIALLEASIKTNTDKIQEWLNTYNDTASATLDITGLRTLLSYDETWRMAEQEALHKIEQALIKATSVFSENRRLREAHALKQTSAKTLEEVSELKNQAKANADNLKQQRNEIGFKLQQDEQDKKKIGSLLQEISLQSSVTEQWSKLNDIIGSADGKKFREIAQEYTLDMLLGYANIHLRALSNRYRIERIPSTLGMQVIDQDMGDDVRTVFSLSGGESFLVSLALALGLASLSSSKMKVESLFIDEGFGSLDPDTLNIAMDALERLHNQGRKVGVISHVQEMTERIPVQIRVRKMASGRSKVEVVG